MNEWRCGGGWACQRSCALDQRSRLGMGNDFESHARVCACVCVCMDMNVWVCIWVCMWERERERDQQSGMWCNKFFRLLLLLEIFAATVTHTAWTDLLKQIVILTNYLFLSKQQ
jgi:hypothetical protein